MEPWQSWAVVLLGGGATWYYYTSRQRSKGRPGRATSISDKVEARTAHRQESSKARKSKDEKRKVASGSESADVTTDKERSFSEKKKKQKENKKTVKTVSHHAVDQSRDDHKLSDEQEDEKTMNKEFAEHMAGLKTGASLAVPAKGQPQKKTVDQSRANHSTVHSSTSDVGPNGQSSRNMSATSSTTGGDADDDLSPAVSPSLAAKSDGPHVSGRDVSDMLEAPAQGPSVLRIIESAQPAKAPRPQQQKPSPPTETKKQRQNRKKAEERKAARAEAEAERRGLLEKQLRRAREAEGRPAKNGMGTSSAAPASSVWNSYKHATNNEDADATPAAVTDRIPLLDTFNHDHTNNHSSVGQVGRPGGTQASKNWHEPVMSEEEQMRMINELDDNAGWNTVSKGKKGRKNKGGADGRVNGQESSESEGRLDYSLGSTGLSDVTAGSSQTNEKTAGQFGYQDPRTAVDASLNGQMTYRHPADSDWAVL